AELRMRMMQLGNQIATAMMYPVFLLCFGTGAMIFLMTWVLPPLLENLQETLTEIPWPTRVARWLSELLVNQGLFLLVAFLGILATCAWAFRQPPMRLHIDGWLMRLPILGPVLVKKHLSRVAMVIGLLVRSGITLDEAVNLASKSTSNRIIQRTLGQCVEDLRSGQDLALSLGRLDWFPPLAARVFAVGQDSGQLDSMLLRLGHDYNQQVKVATSRLTALMEPVLILTMAVLVGFLLVATVLPILQAGQVAQG
ncbi:MAG: type II secretion system F family protein, partial [Planctomycetota bacterium]